MIGHAWLPPGKVLTLALLALTISGVAALAFDARPARSHSEIERSQPDAGAVLREAPARVDAWFDDELRDNGRNKLEVMGPSGMRVDAGEPRLDREDPRHLWVKLQRSLPGGTYVVAWRSSAVDGHVGTGQFEFTVDPTSATASAPADGGASEDSSAGPHGLSRFRSALVALAVAAAGAAVALTLRRMRDQQP